MDWLKKFLGQYHLVYPVLVLKMLVFYWQTDMLDMMNIGRYLRIIWSGEEVPAYEMVCVYEAPVLTVLFLICLFELGTRGDSRPRKILFCVVYTLITLLMFADAAYSGYFGKYTSVNQLYQLGSFSQIAGDGNVIGATFRPGALLTLLDWPFVIWWGMTRKRPEGGSFRKLAGIVSLTILLAASAAGFVYYGFNPVGDRDIQRVNHVEFFTYHTNDILVNVVQKWSRGKVDEKAIQKEMKELVPTTSGSEYRGIAKGRNLILIQTESLNGFVVGRKYHGQEVTPNMNRLIRDQSFYFDHFYSTTGVGNTCDAEFSVLNSLYPNNVRECYRMYVDNTYCGLPWLLREEGYDAVAFHGYLKTFWNRNEAYKTQGFRKFYSQDKLKMTEKSGFGLTDKELFRQATDILARGHKPFFSFMITLTNHIPYELDDKMASLKIEPEDKGTLFGNYLQTVRYTDEAFGELIECLKEKGLYENSMIVIYGDHQGLNLETPGVKEPVSAFLGKEYNYEEMLRVPLLIHIPGMGSGKTISTVGGQVDIMPTIANLMDLTMPQPYVFGHDLLNTEEGFIAQISYVGVGSFVGGSKNKLFVIGKDGTTESGRLLSLETGEEETEDPDYCAKNRDRAVRLLELCREVLDNNLISGYTRH